LTGARGRSTLAAMARQASTPRTKRLAQTATAGMLLAVGLAAIMVKSTPGVYERTAPLGPDRAALRAFNKRVVNHVGNVLLDESGGTRLDLAVTEAMVNARIAWFLDEERRAGREVPAVLAHLRIGFEPGAVVLATRVGRGWSEVVVAQWLRLSADEQGRLRTEPAGTRVGSLPLPGGLIGLLRESAAEVLARGEGAGASDRAEDEAGKQRLRLAGAILDALDGKPVPLGKGKRRILLEAVEVGRGVLRMQGHRAERQDNSDNNDKQGMMNSE